MHCIQFSYAKEHLKYVVKIFQHERRKFFKYLYNGGRRLNCRIHTGIKGIFSALLEQLQYDICCRRKDEYYVHHLKKKHHSLQRIHVADETSFPRLGNSKVDFSSCVECMPRHYRRLLPSRKQNSMQKCIRRACFNIIFCNMLCFNLYNVSHKIF